MTFKRAIAFACLVMSSVGQAGLAQEIHRSYSYTAGNLQSIDEECITGFRDEIAGSFVGLRAIQIDAHSIAEVDNAVYATYSGAIFQSEFGDTTGAITCVYGASPPKLEFVMVVFSGGDLAGYAEHAMAGAIQDPQQWIVSSVAKVLD